ncbi:MAG: hypothetical protein GY856_27880, partial [bacterium]|nr:hypothetical protein [bacterium]
MKSQDEFFAALRTEFGIGAGFAAAALGYFREIHGYDLASMEDVRALEPPHSLRVGYALASNREGRTFFERIAEHVGGPFQRFLDVGCEF